MADQKKGAEKATDKAAGRSRGWSDPLTRPVIAATVSAGGVNYVVEPSETERQALAKALNLADVGALRADYLLQRRSGGTVRLTGRLKGLVRPYCVVTAEAFDLKIDEQVELAFTDPPREGRTVEAVSEITSLDGEDPPDIIENGIIDLGKVTTEFLSLAIPPFPRAPGATFDKPVEADEPSPFSALEKLRKTDR